MFRLGPLWQITEEVADCIHTHAHRSEASMCSQTVQSCKGLAVHTQYNRQPQQHAQPNPHTQHTRTLHFTHSTARHTPQSHRFRRVGDTNHMRLCANSQWLVSVGPCADLQWLVLVGLCLANAVAEVALQFGYSQSWQQCGGM